MTIESGAQVFCSFGTVPTSFTPSGTSGVISDTNLGMNIVPFGMCQSQANPSVAAATAAAQGNLTPQPCVPVVTSQWTPAGDGSQVDGTPAIDAQSTCFCAWGGALTFIS